MSEPSNSDSSEEIVPKTEVISDDENEEPDRKRARVTGSSEGSFDKLVAEAVEKAFKKKKIEESIKVIHKTTLEISDYTIKQVGKLEEKIEKVENLELKAKIEKLQEDNHQKDIDLKSKKSQIQKHEEIQKNLESKLSKMESESEQLKSEISVYKGKLKNSEQMNDKLKEKVKKLEKESTQLKAQSSQIKSEQTQPKTHLKTAVIQRNQARNVIIPSDNCKLPLTTAEQEYLKKCIFCKSEKHKSIECKKYPNHYERRSVVHSEQRRCMKCLNVLESLTNHSCPRANVMCSDCNCDTKSAMIMLPFERRSSGFSFYFHHPILCMLNDQSEYIKIRRQSNNEKRQSQGLPPRFAI